MGVLQLFIQPFLRCDVARDPQLAGRSVRQDDGGGVCLHPPAGALQADDIEFPDQVFAPADAAMVAKPCVPVFVGDEVEGAGAGDIAPVVGLDHAQPGGIHLQQPSVRRHHLDALRRGLDDEADDLVAVGAHAKGPQSVEAIGSIRRVDNGQSLTPQTLYAGRPKRNSP